jgi:membrane associated rhomboid family serine protease
MYLALASLTGNEISIVVGASGAIYAIGGLLMVMRPNIRVLFFFFIPTPLWIAILIGFAMAAIPQVGSGIAWQAHLGGLLFGAAVGYYFRRREIRRF